MPNAQTYAQMHRKFLEQAHPEVLAKLTPEELKERLASVGKTAVETYDLLDHQMRTSPKLPTDFRQRMEAVNAIPVAVEEIVLQEVVYVL